jgi:hypothetical protein
LLGQRDGLCALGAGAMKGEREADEIMAKQMAGRLETLRQIRHPGAGARRVMRFAEQMHGAGMRHDQREDRLEQAGLAGAVQPEQAEGFGGAHGERDIVEDGRRAVAEPEPFDRDGRRRCLDHRRCRRKCGALRMPSATSPHGPAIGEALSGPASGFMLTTRGVGPQAPRPRIATALDYTTRRLPNG